MVDNYQPQQQFEGKQYWVRAREKLGQAEGMTIHQYGLLVTSL